MTNKELLYVEDALGHTKFLETSTKEDKIITLSTCSTTGNRFIVQAVRVDEKAYQ